MAMAPMMTISMILSVSTIAITPAMMMLSSAIRFMPRAFVTAAAKAPASEASCMRSR